MNEFPDRLRRLREKEGIQPCVLAELCGISKNSILRYERDGGDSGSAVCGKDSRLLQCVHGLLVWKDKQP